jgi:hypothetical protein
MKPGDMLQKLHEVQGKLHRLILEGADAWQGLDIDYEPPLVERLWRQEGDLRISLHRIYPCAKALYHPHPWPSAVRIVSGMYEMGIAKCDNKATLPNLIEADSEIAKLVLTKGAEYELIHPYAWHYVKPIGKPSLSIMVTDRPWDPPVFDHSAFGKTADLKALTREASNLLLDAFDWWIAHEH